MKAYLIIAALCAGSYNLVQATQAEIKQHKLAAHKTIDNSLNKLLLAVAEEGDLRKIKKLFAGDSIPDINAKGTGGFTALMIAAYYGHTAIVQALIAAGADLDVQGQGLISMTALMWAAQSNHINIVQLLVAAGARTDILDMKEYIYGKTAFHHAVDKAAFKKAVKAGLKERKEQPKIKKALEEEKQLIPDLSKIIMEYAYDAPTADLPKSCCVIQ